MDEQVSSASERLNMQKYSISPNDVETLMNDAYNPGIDKLSFAKSKSVMKVSSN